MLVNKCLMAVLTLILVCVGISNAVYAQECIYRDEYGEPIMHTGGAAIAAGIALMDPDGSWGVPDNYNTWDLNTDGVPDRAQFELLTDILCMSGVSSHPTVNLDEIRTTYEDNLTMYWELVNASMAAESAIAASGPDIRQAGVEIRTAVNAAGVQDDLLPAEVFGGTFPDGWETRTWQDLGDTLFLLGSDINWMVTNNWLGSPSSPVWLLLNNTATAYTMAALLGLDSDFTTFLFASPSLEELYDLLILDELDWAYILGQLLAFGLTATTAANVENSVNNMDLDESLLPTPDTLPITSNGEDALDGNVLWGDSTFAELYNNNSGDSDAIWEEILTQLPELPIGGAGTVLVLAASCACSGVFFLKRKKR